MLALSLTPAFLALLLFLSTLRRPTPATTQSEREAVAAASKDWMGDEA